MIVHRHIPGRLGRALLAAAALIVFSPTGAAQADVVVLQRRVTLADWNLDPVVLANLAMVSWLYARGWSLLQRLPRRSAARSAVLGSPAQAICFALAMLIILAALVSPLDLISDQLASAHMVQHMLLMTVAAPLLIVAAAAVTCYRGLPPAGRALASAVRRRAGGVVGPIGAHWFAVWWLYALVLWVWHLPLLYGAALRDPLLHDLQHLTFFVAACAFWQLMLGPPRRGRVQGGLAVLLLFTTTLHATVLGVLMTVAPQPWYPEFIGRTELWGLTPLEDQQLAGLIMWMPACASYLLVAIVVFVRALQHSDAGSANLALKRRVAR